MKNKNIGKTLIAITILTAVIQVAAADPPRPPPSPPDPENIVSNNYFGTTSILSCEDNYNPSTNTLSYCDEPYNQFKTKTIFECVDSSGNLEEKGNWSNPAPTCNVPGGSLNQIDTETRQYRTCGENDAENEVNNNVSFPKETTVSGDWNCPGAKALSLRHSPGNLDPGVGLAAKGYSDLDSLTLESNSQMSYSMFAAISACVNRVPMIRTEIDMRDDYTGGETGKVGVFASHMNLYYGDQEGSTGTIQDVNLPEQKVMKRSYDVSSKTDSYRMWAWRQRFAGSLKKTVSSKNLDLPKNVDVGDIANEYEDEGRSVGDLWLSSDFLFGAQAPDPNATEEIIDREIDSTCTQDVSEIDEREFESVEEFRNFAQNNEQEAIDMLGKDGGNYCGIGDDQELSQISDVSSSNNYNYERENLNGTISTKVLDNVTGTVEEIELDVRDVNITFDGNQIENSSQLEYYYEVADQQISSKLLNETEEWQHEDNLSDIKFTDIESLQDVDNPILNSEEEVNYSVELTATGTRHMTGEDFEDYEESDIYEQLEKHVLDERSRFNDLVKPIDRFENKLLASEENNGIITHKEEGKYKGKMKLKTLENQDLTNAYIDISYIEESAERESWNWRALQDVSMTQLAKCMYNWDECMDNSRELPSENWDGTEVMDAGYGPWEESFVYNWSKSAAELAADNLTESIDDSTDYNEPVDTSFDKQYDGARGSQTEDVTNVNVYRRCDSSDGWKSEEGEHYHENHFICPDSDASNIGSADSETVYSCMSRTGTLPNYVVKGNEFDGRQIDGNWHVCRNMSLSEKPSWYEDKEKPEVYVQETTNSDGNEVAEVSCSDDVATCNESSYRLKTYQAGNQPNECPEDYSKYDINKESMEIGGNRYVCGAAKDKVGKEGFSSIPVQFDKKSISTELVYPSDSLRTSYGSSTFMFYEATNLGAQYREVNVSLRGVNAVFTEGDQSYKSFDLVANERKEFELQVTPFTYGTSNITAVTKDEIAGYKLKESMPVYIPEVNASSEEIGSRSVPGIGMIQIVALAIISTFMLIFLRT